MEPVAISSLFPQEEQRAAATAAVSDENGQWRITSYPGTFDTVLMFPCCLFVGCAFGVYSDAVFNDKEATVSIVNCPGYCCLPPFRSSTTIAYGDIANFGWRYTKITETHSPIYDVVLVTRNRRVWRVGTRGRLGVVQQEIKALHKFIFGKGKPNYVAPAMTSLEVPNNDWC
jgi:hypothetical protein